MRRRDCAGPSRPAFFCTFATRAVMRAPARLRRAFAPGIFCTFAPRARNRLPLGDQESVGRDAQRGVMVEATPSASFIVPEPDLLLEFLIVALDPPAQFGDVDQIAER